MEDLRAVLQRFQQYNLKLGMDKCKFACEEVNFLGHRVSRKGIQPTEDKVLAIKNWPVPVKCKCS